MAKTKSQQGDKPGTPAKKAEPVNNRNNRKAPKKHPKAPSKTGRSLFGYNLKRLESMAGIRPEMNQHEKDKRLNSIVEGLKLRRDLKKTVTAAQRRDNIRDNPCRPRSERIPVESSDKQDKIKRVAGSQKRVDEVVDVIEAK